MVDQDAEARGSEEINPREEVRKEKRPKDGGTSYEANARQELRRARRHFSDGQPTPEANFAVSVANVLALLDLAAAIREHGNRQAK
jgi:hypothetical protein